MRRSNECKGFLVLQSREMVNKFSCNIVAGLGAVGMVAITCKATPRERRMKEGKEGEEGTGSIKDSETNPVHEEVTQRFGGGWIGTDFL